MLNGRVK